MYTEKQQEIIDLFNSKKDILSKINLVDWPKNGLYSAMTVKKYFNMTGKAFTKKFFGIEKQSRWNKKKIIKTCLEKKELISKLPTCNWDKNNLPSKYTIKKFFGVTIKQFKNQYLNCDYDFEEYRKKDIIKKFEEKRHLFPLSIKKWDENGLPNPRTVSTVFGMTTNEFRKYMNLPVVLEIKVKRKIRKWDKEKILQAFKKKRNIFPISTKDFPENSLPSGETCRRFFGNDYKKEISKYVPGIQWKRSGYYFLTKKGYTQEQIVDMLYENAHLFPMKQTDFTSYGLPCPQTIRNIFGKTVKQVLNEVLSTTTYNRKPNNEQAVIISKFRAKRHLFPMYAIELKKNNLPTLNIIKKMFKMSYVDFLNSIDIPTYYTSEWKLKQSKVENETSCTSEKECYKSKLDAEKVLKHINFGNKKKKELEVGVYKCKYCSFWHIGSQLKRRKKYKRKKSIQLKFN